MATAKITKKAATKKTAVKTAAKKAVAKKTVAKKTALKKTVTKKTTAGKSVRKTAGMKAGDRYACEVCGLAVIVDAESGLVETAGIICCESPMRIKK